MNKSINLGPAAIMFGSSDCPACLAQFKLINDYILKNKVDGTILYYNLKKQPVPKCITNPDGSYAMPTWYIPDKNGMGGTLQPGLRKSKLGSLVQKRPKNRFSSFGSSPVDIIPQINTLAVDGKNFPNGQGFDIQNSWANQLQSIWGVGNAENAGTLGREFGPGNFGNVYSNDYLNNIRMAQPGGDLDTVLAMNRTCNMYKSNTDTPGLIYNSPNPQIVGFNGFGTHKRVVKKAPKSKFRFGTGLYNQMGPAYGSSYITNDKGLMNSLYTGGGQWDPSLKPISVQNPNYYIGTASPVQVKNVSLFGRGKTKPVKTVKSNHVKSTKKVKHHHASKVKSKPKTIHFGSSHHAKIKSKPKTINFGSSHHATKSKKSAIGEGSEITVSKMGKIKLVR